MRSSSNGLMKGTFLSGFNNVNKNIPPVAVKIATCDDHFTHLHDATLTFPDLKHRQHTKVANPFYETLSKALH
jgi:hypothetical protein